jgi:hypothetical protein
MLNILQASVLTAVTVSFPFRMWLVMLEAEEAMEDARRARSAERATRLSEIRAELATHIGSAAALDYGSGELGPMPAFEQGLA